MVSAQPLSPIFPLHSELAIWLPIQVFRKRVTPTAPRGLRITWSSGSMGSQLLPSPWPSVSILPNMEYLIWNTKLVNNPHEAMQHSVETFALQVEYNPGTSEPVISSLSCSQLFRSCAVAQRRCLRRWSVRAGATKPFHLHLTRFLWWTPDYYQARTLRIECLVWFTTSLWCGAITSVGSYTGSTQPKQKLESLMSGFRERNRRTPA